MIKWNVEGVDKLLAKIDDLKAFRKAENFVFDGVKNASIPLKEQIESGYTAAGHYNPKRKSGKHLVDTINTFKRKRKSKDDPFFTYYVGPKFGSKKEPGQGGQQAVFIEWGAGPPRQRAKPGRGAASLGKGRVYGSEDEKYDTGVVKAYGVIRTSVDQVTGTVVSKLKDAAIAAIKKIWNE